MAITRRQFVTRLGALAGAMGVSQSQLAKMTEAFAYGNFGAGKWTKPKVIWIHGAECTGCSTSVLGLLEDATETIEATTASGTSLTLIDALAAAAGTDTSTILSNYRTRVNNGLNFEETAYVVDIADVLIDFIDLQYHETVMGAAGDLAAQFLKDQMDNSASGGAFVLVVEGAVQPTSETGYWDSDPTGGNSILGSGDLPWCSIGADGTVGGATFDIAFEDAVADLASSAACYAVIAIGQCACFGGYPGCVSPVLRGGMTGAMGVYEYLHDHLGGSYATVADDKVINVPGCPTNPWWFALNVVAWLVDANAVLGGGSPVIGVLDSSAKVNAAAVDRDRRVKAVYDYPIHGNNCPRWPQATTYNFATDPGDSGCMRDLGCKGVFTRSMCGVHGWNGQQPKLISAPQWNAATNDYGVADECKTVGNGRVGGFCIAAGSTCKGCTERGYPDSFVPFIALQ